MVIAEASETPASEVPDPLIQTAQIEDEGESDIVTT